MSILNGYAYCQLNYGIGQKGPTSDVRVQPSKIHFRLNKAVIAARQYSKKGGIVCHKTLYTYI